MSEAPPRRSVIRGIYRLARLRLQLVRREPRQAVLIRNDEPAKGRAFISQRGGIVDRIKVIEATLRPSQSQAGHGAVPGPDRGDERRRLACRR